MEPFIFVLCIIAIVSGAGIAKTAIKAWARVEGHRENIARMNHGYPPIGSEKGKKGAKRLIERVVDEENEVDDSFEEYDEYNRN